jgi:hypothetical protein
MGAFSACQLTIIGEAFMVGGGLELQELPSMQGSAAATPILSRDNLISVRLQSLNGFVIVFRE